MSDPAPATGWHFFPPITSSWGDCSQPTRNPAATQVSAYKWLILTQDSIQGSSPVLSDLRKSMNQQEINKAEQEVDKWGDGIGKKMIDKARRGRRPPSGGAH